MLLSSPWSSRPLIVRIELASIGIALPVLNNLAPGFPPLGSFGCGHLECIACGHVKKTQGFFLTSFETGKSYLIELQ